MKPNLVFIFSDQHRHDATGYAGDPNVITPNLDRLAADNIRFMTAVSTVPVCSPARATLLTGRYPLSHRVIVNDVPLAPDASSFADAFREAGYDTGYIGKWHLDGREWSCPIEKERRHGFEFWKVAECDHDYFNGFFFDEENNHHSWVGYDAEAQTRTAQDFINKRAEDSRPFALFLAWGPPHDPYETAPQEFVAKYAPEKLTLRPNVPENMEQEIRPQMAGYYAHITALDRLIGELEQTLVDVGLEEETILIYTSDHGIMLGSHGALTKERPWDESILVPFVMKWPGLRGTGGIEIREPIGTPDVMPTVLDLCGVPIPSTVEGKSLAPFIRDRAVGKNNTEGPRAALIECIQPFGSWGKIYGGKEYRGIRTARYTYVRDRNGPWLLYDNDLDPYQQTNRVDDAECADQRAELDTLLSELLSDRGDRFGLGEEYMSEFGYVMDRTGRVPFVY